MGRTGADRYPGPAGGLPPSNGLNVARKTQIPKQDAERALNVLEIEKKNWPAYKQPSTFGSYVALILALAAAGFAVYYALNHKEQVSELWYRATHREAVPSQVEPGE